MGWVQPQSLDLRHFPGPALRDGKKAISLATRGCELSGWQSQFALGCLAAACAEAGDFKSAVNWQKQAIDLLTTGDPVHAKHRERLLQFEKNQPYRDQGDD